MRRIPSRFATPSWSPNQLPPAAKHTRRGDARLAGSVFVSRIHRWTCCSKSRKDAPRRSEKGAFSATGSAAFHTITPVPTPAPHRVPTTFPGPRSIARSQRGNLGGSPEDATKRKKPYDRSLPTKNWKGAPPRETQKRKRDLAQFSSAKRSWSRRKWDCRKPTYERTLHMIAHEMHSNVGRMRSCPIILAHMPGLVLFWNLRPGLLQVFPRFPP